MKYQFYATRQEQYNLHKRILIPFIWQGRTIGYTARAIEENVKPKYHSNYEPNFVFNINNQLLDSKFVIVCEGPFDAMSIDGVAVLNNEHWFLGSEWEEVYLPIYGLPFTHTNI